MLALSNDTKACLLKGADSRPVIDAGDLRHHLQRNVDFANVGVDQEVVSAARDALEPALVLAPAPDVCRTMGDKYLAHAFFESHGIPSPRTWLPEDVPDDVRYPVLVKVREGFGSRHIYRADDEDAPPDKWIKLNPQLHKTASFRDERVQVGKKYFYQITAVDAYGNESARSETVSETVAP